jgi:aminoglycoside phosphotransferase (APT) family kinase protein
MSLPAARDCEINDALVARVLREQFPAHAPHAVRYLGAGWDHVAYELNATWIVRMPMRASVAARVPIELAVLELARVALPLALPVIELRGAPSALYPYPFSGYRKLPGVIAEDAPLERWCTRDNARVLGAALGALHGIAIERARAAGVLDASAAEHGCADRAERVLQAQPRLQAALGHQRARRCAAFLEQRPLIAAGAGARVLRHDDLHLEHVLLDAGMQRVTGIIDWTDASIGDPAAEFVALWLSCGEAFVRDMLDAYHGPSDPDMLARIRIRARWSTLDWLARSLERDRDRIGARFADFERAFPELTSPRRSTNR